MLKSDILPYKFAYLSMVKNISPQSKNINCAQNIFKATKYIFEQADGLGNSVFQMLVKKKYSMHLQNK